MRTEGEGRLRPHSPLGLSLSKALFTCARHFDKLNANGGERHLRPHPPFGLSLSKAPVTCARAFRQAQCERKGRGIFVLHPSRSAPTPRSA